MSSSEKRAGHKLAEILTGSLRPAPPLQSGLFGLVAPSLGQYNIQTPKDFGTLLRDTRKAQGLTQQQFADLAGVGRRFIVECEAGKPRLEFARVLQVAASAGIDIVAKKR